MRPRKLTWVQKNSSQSSRGPCKLTQDNIITLNDKLAESSYVHGFEFSQIDMSLHEALGNYNLCEERGLEHLKRWRKHIQTLAFGSVLPKKCDKSTKEKIEHQFG